MMIPEAWQSDRNMAQAKKDFYEYHSALMEPGTVRLQLCSQTANTLVPCLTATDCGLAAITSPMTTSASWRPKSVCCRSIRPTLNSKGVCNRAKCFLIDFDQGRLIPDEEVKGLISGKDPTGNGWRRSESPGTLPTPHRAVFR